MNTDGAWGQRAAIALAGASQIGANILMGTVMAVYVGRVGSPFAVGMVATAYFLGMIVSAPVWGAIADITGRRRAVLVVTGALATVSALALPFVDGVWGLIGSRGIFAVFSVGFVPVILSIVSEHGGAAGRGRWVGFYTSSRSIGFTGAQLLSGVLLGLLVPSMLYLVIAGVSLVATLAAVLIDDPTPPPETEPGLTELVREIRRRLLPAVDERDHLKTNGLGWLYVALVLRNMTWLGMSSLLPVYFIAEVGTSTFVMGALLALAPGIEIVGMYLFGHAADGVGRKPLITMGIAGHVAFALLLAGATRPVSVTIGVAVVGLGMLVKGVSYSALTTGAIAFIGDVTPVARRSELMGLRSTAKGVGGVFGPVLLGAIATVVNYEVAFVAGATLAVAATVLASRTLVESHPATDRSPVDPAGVDD